MHEFRRATALLVRRLRLDLRAIPGNLLRLFAAACILFTTYVVAESGVSVSAPGLMVYRWIVWVDSLLISISGVTIFASIIAGEREQGTLGLLRMTGMNPVSLMLGQGFSGIVIGCLLLAVQFPFIVLTITLGGVLWDQVLATYLALLAHLVLCAGIGLFWSVVCARAGSASFYTILILGGLWLGTWITRFGATRLTNKGWISTRTHDAIDVATVWLDQRLVWNQLSNIDTAFGGIPMTSPQFWWSISVGIGFLLLAALLLDLRPFETPAYSPIVIRLWRSSGGNRAWNLLPVTGKDYRQFMGGAKGLVARVILYLLVPTTAAWAVMEFGGTALDFEDFATNQFWFSAAFLTVESAAIASRLFRTEMADMTWSSLAVLPRRRLRIIAEKLLGSFLGILPGIAICLLAGACSTEVERFFFGPFHRSDGLLVPLMFLAQPILWVAVTGLSSLFAVSVPPTVTIFCGLVGLIAQYCLVLLCALLALGRTLSFDDFAGIYLSATFLLVCFCLLAAALRLRKLTERN